ncbi:unnamed protein product, partial [Meganyctiphanes norvegica]
MVDHCTSPLVVVANRLPFSLGRRHDGSWHRKQTAGGLVTAVAPVVVETGGLWVGWSGIYVDDNPPEIMPESDPDDKSPTAGLKTAQVIPINIDKKLFTDYYNGCCNACFWPLFHSMPDRAIFEAEKWDAYHKVNEEFARLTVGAVQRAVAENPGSTPLVWLHDYHLMLAATFIREACDKLGIKVKIAFFLHIPFPSWDIMRLFPWDDEVLQGILGCDSIGFHTDDYCLNFIDCCQRKLGCRVDRQKMLVGHNMRTVGVHCLPISIPYERFHKLALEAPIVVNNPEKEQLILGVDRLDYTKGLVNRLKAYEQLLEKYPEHLNRVTFLQVAVPSRTDVKEYQDLKEEMDRLVGLINGQFSTANWSPIRYIYGCVSQDQLAGFYRDSAVCVVTPLRDGMNLVAKEYVACQTADPGVLLLSPFAGAGQTMHEAILTNPYECNEFADAIHRALIMPHDERSLRMNQLQRREREQDVNYWLRSFLKSVDCLANDSLNQINMEPWTELDFDNYLTDYVTESSRLAILLDYDGTLAPIAPHPDLAKLSDETHRVLERISRMPDVNVAIISGRSLENVRSMVGIDGITYAGNHGLQISHPDGTLFTHPIPKEYEDKLDILKKRLRAEACTDNAWLEDKQFGITYHYRKVEEDKLEEIRNRAQKIFEEVGIELHQAKMALEAKPPILWDKGRASIYILRTLFGLDWSGHISTIFAGDDTTDEDAMKALKGIAVTFRITNLPNLRTSATYRLPSTDAVHTMLKWIDKRLGARLPTKRPSFSNSPGMSRNTSGSDDLGRSMERLRSSHSISEMMNGDIYEVRQRASSMSDMKRKNDRCN